MLAATAVRGRAGDRDVCLSSNAGVILQHTMMRREIWHLWGAPKWWIHQHRAQVAEHTPAPPAGNIFCVREEWVGKTAFVYNERTEHHTVPKPTQSRVVNKHYHQKIYAISVCVGGDDCLHLVCTVKGNSSPRSLSSLLLGQTACHWAAPLTAWLDFSTCSAQSS